MSGPTAGLASEEQRCPLQAKGGGKEIIIVEPGSGERHTRTWLRPGEVVAWFKEAEKREADDRGAGEDGGGRGGCGGPRR